MNKKLVIPVVNLLLLVVMILLLFYLTPIKTFTLIPVFLFLIISFAVQMTPFMFPDIRETPIWMGICVLDGIYLIAQIAVSFWAVLALTHRTGLVWIVCTAMFLLYLAVTLIFRSTTLAESKRAGVEKQKEYYIKKVTVMLEHGKEAARDEEIKKEISAIMESIKYSDPNSGNEVVDIEREIFDRAELLLEQIQGNKTMDAKENCSILQNKIKERNLMCKMYKR